MTISSIFFDPNDEGTRRFLKEIGVNDDTIAFGRISPYSDEARTAVNVSAITILANIKEESKDRYFLSSVEAKRGLELLNSSRGHLIRALFKRDRCPGAGDSANQILANMIGMFEVVNLENNSILIEKYCPYSSLYTVREQEGIHFSKQMVPEKIRATSDTIVRIAVEKSQFFDLTYKAKYGKSFINYVLAGSQGSGIIISKNGLVVTASHVIRDDENKFLDKLYAHIKDKVSKIKEENIIYENATADIAILHLPELAGIQPAALVAAPPKAGEEVWIAGWPPTDANVATFTPGIVSDIYVDVDGKSLEVFSSARALKGDSGGAMFDANGKLLGVLTHIGGRVTSKSLNTEITDLQVTIFSKAVLPLSWK